MADLETHMPPNLDEVLELNLGGEEGRRPLKGYLAFKGHYQGLEGISPFAISFFLLDSSWALTLYVDNQVLPFFAAQPDLHHTVQTLSDKVDSHHSR